ncbi:VanZ family protein [Streptomyces sp. NPDC096040]|uniref:VanZ family protein n=1 Tax=Streptomyces sp. NPDC096040 TaxID=3155541 RepID=UPI00331BC75A
MLEAVFRGHIYTLALGCVFIIFAGTLAFRIVSGRAAHPALVGLWVSSLIGVVYLTMWSTGGSQGPGSCTINRDLIEPFAEQQGQMNVAMFAPVGVLGVLATRRVSMAALIGVALSACIETTQGVFPILGRACDTSDFVTNSTGAVIGALVGWAVVKVERQGSPPRWDLQPKAFAFAAIPLIGVLTTAWVGYIQPHSVARTSAVADADSAQVQAVRKQLQQAFGRYYSLRRVQFNSQDGIHGTVFASLRDGTLEMSWPGQTDLTASIDISNTSGFPLAGATSAKTAANAKSLALTYARGHYPSAVTGSNVSVSGVGQDAALGWIVSFRRRHHGILMPMRLDVEVTRYAKVSQMSVRLLPDVDIPDAKISRQNAAKIVRRTQPNCPTASADELLAVRSHGTWRTVWRVSASCSDSTKRINVNAVTGSIESVESRPTVPSATTGSRTSG